MKVTPAIYLGRIVEKHNFRAFIYGADGQRRLVESWEEFEANIQTGVWFATAEDAKEIKDIVDNIEDAKEKTKPKPKPKAKTKPELQPIIEDDDEVLSDDGSVFEVKDDFLPNEGK